MSSDGDADIRRRALHTEEQEEGGTSQEGEGPGMTNGETDWGVDDEGWTPQSNKPESPQERRRRILRRPQSEVAIAFAYHLLVLCAYIYIHVYDATIMKRSGGKGFEGAASYGGRWKYLTYINLWIQFIYFFLSFFTDIMPRSPAKKMFQDVADFVFNTMAFPMAAFVALTFWGIYAIDREMVYPAILDQYIPQILNHLWHTAILVFVVLESLLVFHPFPSTNKAIAMLFSFSTFYIVWSSIVRINGDRWAYPFLNLMPPPVISLFFAVCFFITLGLYYVGKKTARIRFAARHRLLEEEVA